MAQEKLYARLAGLVAAVRNCEQSGNWEWFDRHMETVDRLLREHLPSGSGFNSGTSFDWEKSTVDRLVFNTAFHHLTEHGYYSGWTEHAVTVRPSLAFAFTLSISGRNRNGIKDYITDVFRDALTQEVDK